MKKRTKHHCLSIPNPKDRVLFPEEDGKIEELSAFFSCSMCGRLQLVGYEESGMMIIQCIFLAQVVISIIDYWFCFFAFNFYCSFFNYFFYILRNQ